MQWGSLIPDEFGISTMYRLNTYPVIHSGFFHAFLNVLALTPLLERFEVEHGTLTAVALFIGRKCWSDIAFWQMLIYLSSAFNLPGWTVYSD